MTLKHTRALFCTLGTSEWPIFALPPRRIKARCTLAALFLLGALAYTNSALSEPGEFRNTLMPEPTSLSLQPGSFQIDTSMTVGFTGTHDDLLEQATTRALTRLEDATGVELNKSFGSGTATFEIKVDRAAEEVQSLDEDESYTLAIRPGYITLNAPTDLGAMHGLQTLLQLVQHQSGANILPAVTISDAPRFRWRGLMIDCGRHFEPVPVIRPR